MPAYKRNDLRISRNSAAMCQVVQSLDRGCKRKASLADQLSRLSAYPEQRYQLTTQSSGPSTDKAIVFSEIRQALTLSESLWGTSSIMVSCPFLQSQFRHTNMSKVTYFSLSKDSPSSPYDQDYSKSSFKLT